MGILLLLVPSEHCCLPAQSRSWTHASTELPLASQGRFSRRCHALQRPPYDDSIALGGRAANYAFVDALEAGRSPFTGPLRLEGSEHCCLPAQSRSWTHASFGPSTCIPGCFSRRCHARQRPSYDDSIALGGRAANSAFVDALEAGRSPSTGPLRLEGSCTSSSVSAICAAQHACLSITTPRSAAQLGCLPVHSSYARN